MYSYKKFPFILSSDSRWKPPLEFFRARIIWEREEYITKPYTSFILERELATKTIFSLIDNSIKNSPIITKNLDIFKSYHHDLTYEKIIIDPLAFYVPYHFYPKEWGIYFRINKILHHYQALLRKYGAHLGVVDILSAIEVWRIFFDYIYMHELTHHIVEDISSLKGDPYPLLNRNEEEGLAEWHSFTTIERENAQNTYLLNSRLPFNKERSLIDEYEFRKLVLSAIYYFMGREKDHVYKPIVYPSVVKKLGRFWLPVREASVREGYVYLVNDVEEVYDRLYFTQY